MGEECPWCMGYGTQFWKQVVFYKGHSRREMGSQKSACVAKPPTKKAKPPPKSAAQRIPVESGEHVQEFKVKWSRTKKFYTEPVKE